MSQRLTPLLPTFATGEYVTTRRLNAIGAHVGNLFDQSVGGFRASKPMCVLRRNPVESVPGQSGLLYHVGWDVVEADTDTPAMFDPAQDFYVTIQTSGYWLLDLTVTASVADIPVSGSYGLVSMALNGPNIQKFGIASVASRVRTGADGIRVHCQVALPLAASDVVYPVFQQNSGSTMTLSGTPGSCRFTAEWLAPLTPIGG